MGADRSDTRSGGRRQPEAAGVIPIGDISVQSGDAVRDGDMDPRKIKVLLGWPQRRPHPVREGVVIDVSDRPQPETPIQPAAGSALSLKLATPTGPFPPADDSTKATGTVRDSHHHGRGCPHRPGEYPKPVNPSGMRARSLTHGPLRTSTPERWPGPNDRSSRIAASLGVKTAPAPRSHRRRQGRCRRRTRRSRPGPAPG